MKNIIIFFICTLPLIGFSQAEECGPICLESSIELIAPCTDNLGGTYNYTVSPLPDLVSNGDGTATFTPTAANYSAGDVVSISIICECVDLSGCESIQEFEITIGDNPEFLCQMGNFGSGLGYTPDGSEGDCMHVVCEGGNATIWIDNAPAGSTVTWSDGQTVGVNSFTQRVNFCDDCTCTDGNGANPWEYILTGVLTTPDGCTADIEAKALIKCPEQEGSCDPASN